MKHNTIFLSMSIVVILSMTIGSTALAIPSVSKQESSIIDSPFILASMNGNFVIGYNWQLGNLVTMTIDDPSTGPGIDYTDTALSISYGQPGLSTQALFNLNNHIYLQPGFTINLTDGSISKSLLTANLYVTGLDISTNTVSGTATPGMTVKICPDENIAGDCRFAIADSNGDWTALPYSLNTFILKPGLNGWAVENDDDGDQTYYHWNVSYLHNYLPIIIK